MLHTSISENDPTVGHTFGSQSQDDTAAERAVASVGNGDEEVIAERWECELCGERNNEGYVCKNRFAKSSLGGCLGVRVFMRRRLADRLSRAEDDESELQ